MNYKYIGKSDFYLRKQEALKQKKVLRFRKIRKWIGITALLMVFVLIF